MNTERLSWWNTSTRARSQRVKRSRSCTVIFSISMRIPEVDLFFTCVLSCSIRHFQSTESFKKLEKSLAHATLWILEKRGITCTLEAVLISNAFQSIVSWTSHPIWESVYQSGNTTSKFLIRDSPSEVSIGLLWKRKAVCRKEVFQEPESGVIFLIRISRFSWSILDTRDSSYASATRAFRSSAFFCISWKSGISKVVRGFWITLVPGVGNIKYTAIQRAIKVTPHRIMDQRSTRDILLRSDFLLYLKGFSKIICSHDEEIIL